MLNLILLRGLPGAGKSSLAAILSENGRWPVYSVDDYFTNPAGHYNFNPYENHIAYKHCADRTAVAMQNSVPKIFLDNTFTLEWEMEPYFKLAQKYSYRIFVMTVENRHGNQNLHEISNEQIRKMAEKYQVKLF